MYSLYSVPLPNGHNLKDSLDAHSLINKSAHQNNLEIETHDFAPTTNGVDHNDDHKLDNTPSSFEQSSDLPSSAETGDSHPLSSSQSAPDDIGDQSALKLDEPSLDPSPAIVQQPISDVREETHPASVEQSTGVAKQSPEITSLDKPESATETMSSATDPTIASGPVAESSLPATTEDPQANALESSVPVEAQSSVTDSTPATAPLEEPLTIPTTEVADHPPVPVPEGAAAEAPVDPAPSPVRTTAISPPEHLPEVPQDQTMQDAPASPSKVAREREDDDGEGERAAKRSKTDNEPSPDFKVPERPTVDTQINEEQAGEAAPESHPITGPQYKVLTRTMTNVKRIQASLAFRQPVDIVALKIPTYFNYVTKPMDLRTLEENLKGGKYASVDAFRADFNQIVENARIFNGPDHLITKAAYDMKASFDKTMQQMPGPDVVDPEKKKKAILPPAAKPTAPRRESRSSLPGSARSPVSAVSTPTFALNPQGVPLIRRDSTLGDGRPKREIHPPAPRDLPYANQKPKKKKYVYELKFCEKVWNEIAKPRYARLAYPFMVPVDPVALNIPSYHSIIKKPMDFGTIKTKLDNGEYENAKEFEADAKQVFQNCYKFNRPGDDIYKIGQELESIFDSEWARKRNWIEANTPASGAQSPGSSDVEESDDEEDEEEEEDEEASQLTKLQQQIAQMSRQVEMITQKKKSPPVSNKKAAKSAKAPRKDTKKAAAPARVEKKAASKPAKKTPYVTYEQKQDISNRINALSQSKMAAALNIIRSSMPNLKGVQDDELELDIDELSDEVLHKLLAFVRKHVPRPDDSPVQPPPATSSAAPTRKKNKPMSKHEQEARIAQVQSGLSAFQNPGSAPVCKSKVCLRTHVVSLQCNTDDDPGPDQESSAGEESSESEEE